MGAGGPGLIVEINILGTVMKGFQVILDGSAGISRPWRLVFRCTDFVATLTSALGVFSVWMKMVLIPDATTGDN